MKTHTIPALTVISVASALAFVAPAALAQHAGHTMPMPSPSAKPKPENATPAKPKPKPKPAARNPAATPATAVDHAAMGHAEASTSGQSKPANSSMQGMDHSQVSQPTTPTAEGQPADEGMEGMDHSSMQGMDHSQKGQPTTQPAQGQAADDEMQGMDHSSMQGMDHSQMGQPGTQPAEGQPADDGMQGMDHSSMQGMDHSQMGHTMPAPTQPREPIPALTDADRAAAFPDVAGHAVHDRAVTSYFLFNRLEAFDADEGTGFQWEGQGWIGGDINRLWLRSEGERVGGLTESADLEVLYGRGIARWWDLVAGVRHDFKPGESQSFAAIGIQGLAPQKFEVEATAYVGERGQTAARFEVEYELLLTNRLILQPLVEVNLFGKNDPARGIGSGLSTAEAGLRLRYEFTRKFAPYIGVVYERAYGGTADFRRDEGEDIDDTRLVIGLRTWF